jgi:hypothetical protein
VPAARFPFRERPPTLSDALRAAAIVNAAEHPNPRARYVVPSSARALITLLTMLPDKLADRAKQRAVAGS